MRILPLNNYNYQSKVQNNAQNNKQQNVNFGLFHGTPEPAGKFLKLTDFCDGKNFLRVILAQLDATRMGKAEDFGGVLTDSFGMGKRQVFTAAERQTVRRLIKKAEDKNLIGGLDECRLTRETDFGKKPTEVLL